MSTISDMSLVIYLLIKSWVVSMMTLESLRVEVLARFELMMSHLNWPSFGNLPNKGVCVHDVHPRDLAFTGKSPSTFNIH